MIFWIIQIGTVILSLILYHSGITLTDWEFYATCILWLIPCMIAFYLQRQIAILLDENKQDRHNSKDK